MSDKSRDEAMSRGRLFQRCNHCDAPIHSFFPEMADDSGMVLGVCQNGHDSILLDKRF